MDPCSIRKTLEEAVALHNAERLPEAEALYRRVLQLDPRNHDALHLLGVVAGQTDHPQHAVSLIGNAILLNPTVAIYHRSLGDVYARIDRHSEAVTEYRTALRMDHNEFASRAGLAWSLLEWGKKDEARDELKIATQSPPPLDAAPTSIAILASALVRVGEVQSAMEMMDRALGADPQSTKFWIGFGSLLWEEAWYEQALHAARQAVKFSRDDPAALILLGNTLQTTGALREAVDAYRAALKVRPESFDAFNNMGLTLLKLGEVEQAEEVYEEGARRWPEDAKLLSNRSLVILTRGNLKRGFEEYEWRWKHPAWNYAKNIPRPRWTGEPIEGKSILIQTEQGAGDVVQFIRYAPMIAQRGPSKVIVTCSPDLIELLKTVEGVTDVSAHGDPLPPFDVYAAVLSLPWIFGTTLETVPSDVPYITADPVRVARWRERLAAESTKGLRVGLVWAGNPKHQNDRCRSMRLADFAPLANVEGVEFYSLQKGEPASQLSESPPGMKIMPLGDEIDDYSDTAALLENLDLLISVDTSVVHLAGALARPVWTLLPRGPDWRWMLDREDSPWYPTMRLFRQKILHDWPELMQRVAGELARFARGPS